MNIAGRHNGFDRDTTPAHRRWVTISAEGAVIEHLQLESVEGHADQDDHGNERMIRPERVVLDRLVSYRYRRPDADHALIVQPGPAKDDRLTELFCAHHAARGVDVWAVAATPYRIPDRVADSITLGHHISHQTGLPVFMMATRLGAAVAHRAVHASNVFWGAVLVGSAHDIACPITAQDNAASESLCDNTARPTQQPRVGAMCEASPILWIVGQNETFGLTADNTEGRAATEYIEVCRHNGELDELLGSPAAVSDITLNWSLTQFGNHFNPKWMP